MENWAGNLTYSTSRILRPQSVEEAQAAIAAVTRIRPLGTRHSFSRVADSNDALLSTEHIDRVVAFGERSVTVEGGIRYGELGRALHAQGLALANFASLPHISVAGAVATATHGTGSRNSCLAAAVSEIDLVVGDGSLVQLRRGDDDFEGAVVALGALGLVARLTLDVLPAFDLRLYVFDDLPWTTAESSLHEILAGGYSVSLFTLWTDAGVDQVWLRTADDLAAESYFGARPAGSPRHPIPGTDPVHCTEQLGVPGPSHERLAHFRFGFTPSAGDELQTEYIVPREHAVDALRALRGLGPQITPLLLTSEIRAIAADTLWLSPFYERDGVAFHFTWKPRSKDVLALLPTIESTLARFEPRPHWGKLFLASPAARYPRLQDFRALRERLDPSGKFRSEFLDQLGM
jgi:xylitol oxidase